MFQSGIRTEVALPRLRARSKSNLKVGRSESAKYVDYQYC